MRTKAAQAQIVAFHSVGDTSSAPVRMPPGASTLPMFCATCHGAITLQFIGEWLEENLDQTWACPHCRQMNRDGFPYRLAWVTRDHEKP